MKQKLIVFGVAIVIAVAIFGIFGLLKSCEKKTIIDDFTENPNFNELSKKIDEYNSNSGKWNIKNYQDVIAVIDEYLRVEMIDLPQKDNLMQKLDIYYFNKITDSVGSYCLLSGSTLNKTELKQEFDRFDEFAKYDSVNKIISDFEVTFNLRGQVYGYVKDKYMIDRHTNLNNQINSAISTNYFVQQNKNLKPILTSLTKILSDFMSVDYNIRKRRFNCSSINQSFVLYVQICDSCVNNPNKIDDYLNLLD